MSAQENQVALPLRSHTILGVCEAIGEDFHFNPVFLRVPLAASVIVSPMLAIGTYLALGVVVMLSRFLYPNGNATSAVESAEQPASVERETGERELPLAA